MPKRAKKSKAKSSKVNPADLAAIAAKAQAAKAQAADKAAPQTPPPDAQSPKHQCFLTGDVIPTPEKVRDVQRRGISQFYTASPAKNRNQIAHRELCLVKLSGVVETLSHIFSAETPLFSRVEKLLKETVYKYQLRRTGEFKAHKHHPATTLHLEHYGNYRIKQADHVQSALITLQKIRKAIGSLEAVYSHHSSAAPISAGATAAAVSSTVANAQQLELLGQFINFLNLQSWMLETALGKFSANRDECQRLAAVPGLTIPLSSMNPEKPCPVPAGEIKQTLNLLLAEKTLLSPARSSIGHNAQDFPGLGKGKKRHRSPLPAAASGAGESPLPDTVGPATPSPAKAPRTPLRASPGTAEDTAAAHTPPRPRGALVLTPMGQAPARMQSEHDDEQDFPRLGQGKKRHRDPLPAAASGAGESPAPDTAGLATPSPAKAPRTPLRESPGAAKETPAAETPTRPRGALLFTPGWQGQSPASAAASTTRVAGPAERIMRHLLTPTRK